MSLSSHRRYNLLTGEWILVSPQRTSRPWQGKVEKFAQTTSNKYDPNCYLCPNNQRANGNINPNYNSTFVFDNDFSALDFKSDSEENSFGNKLLIAKNEKGICRVVCFSPIHNLSLGEMSVDDIKLVIDTWCDEYKNLGSKEEINYIQIFENKGEMMGCSNPHPHCQIWATQSIPNEPLKETINQKKYYDENKNCLLCDYINMEEKLSQRLVFKNDEFVLLVPFWAIWPFETMIISKKHLRSLNDFDDQTKYSFAEILKATISNYDKLFDVSFPYSAGIHQSPTDNNEHNEWHFHFHFYPPLLRSATIKKFLVGYEMLAEPQRDLTPEDSAQKLKILFQNKSSRL